MTLPSPKHHWDFNERRLHRRGPRGRRDARARPHELRPCQAGLRPPGLQWLGSTGGNAEHASVIIDDARIFDVALTDEELAELMREKPSNPSLIRNGSFEDGPAVTGDAARVKEGSQDITAWIVSRGEVDCCTSSLWDAAEGAQSLHLNGGKPGGIQQTFATTPGVLYSVTFALAGNPGDAPPAKVMRVEVTPSTPPQGATFEAPSAGLGRGDMGWQRCTWHFTAQATTTTLELFSLTEGAYGPVIDDVAVWRGAPSAREEE